MAFSATGSNTQCQPPWHRLVSFFGANLLAEFLEFDRKTRFTGEYMTKVDGGAMRYAVEADPFPRPGNFGSSPVDCRSVTAARHPEAVLRNRSPELANGGQAQKRPSVFRSTGAGRPLGSQVRRSHA